MPDPVLANLLNKLSKSRLPDKLLTVLKLLKEDRRGLPDMASGSTANNALQSFAGTAQRP